MPAEQGGRKRGAKHKILAILDGSEECLRAVFYAAAQAKNTGGGLALLFVIDDSDFRQIFGVEHIMRAEARELAEAALRAAAAAVRQKYQLKAEEIIREGQKLAEITALTQQDSAIALLVLAAGSAHDGPGPLIQTLIGSKTAFSLPVTVLPANLSDEGSEELA